MIDRKSLLTEEAIQAAKEHARAEYPKESCGIVFEGKYVPCVNIAENPEQDFEISPRVWAEFAQRGRIEAVLHSHPKGPLFPTQADMEGQLRTAVPWGIIPCIEEEGEWRVGDPILWGDQLERLPLLGREFIHGISDCYSLIRDVFFLGRERLAAEGISDKWPFDPINLPEVPRDDAWWDQEGQDLYTAGIEKNGFRIIQQHEARAGDGFLIKVRSDKLNHGGLLVTDDVIIHHLPGRLSRREPAGLWGRQADLWVRYEGEGANA